jgi:hypothetical protein
MKVAQADSYEQWRCQVEDSVELPGVSCAQLSAWPFVPAYLPQTSLTVLASRGPEHKWQPRLATAFLHEHPWYVTLLGKLACVLHCGDLLDANEPRRIDLAKLRTSCVPHWLGLLRYNLLQFGAGQLEEPHDMAFMYGTMKQGQRLERSAHSMNKMKGCKVQHLTFDKHVRDARRHFGQLHQTAAVFPMQNSQPVRDAMMDAYKAARFTSSSGHEWSEMHLRLACAIHALCPQVLPHAQPHDQAQASQIATHVHDAFARFQSGLQLRNARRWADEWLPKKRARAEVQQDRAHNGHKRVAKVKHGVAKRALLQRQ